MNKIIILTILTFSFLNAKPVDSLITNPQDSSGVIDSLIVKDSSKANIQTKSDSIKTVQNNLTDSVPVSKPDLSLDDLDAKMKTLESDGYQMYTPPKFRLTDKIVAVVENDIILMSDVNSVIQYYLMQNKTDINSLSKEQFKGMQSKVLNQMITTKIITFQAKKESLTVNSSRISKEVDKQIDQIIDQLGSKSALIDELNKQGLDIIEFRKKKFKQMKDQMLQMNIKRKIKNSFNLNRTKVLDFYKIYRDSFPAENNAFKLAIYKLPITVSQSNDSILILKLSKIRKEIIDGKITFEDAAKKYSQGPSAANGGDLGFFGKGDMVPIFEKTAFALNPGEISKIIKSQFGYHIIKVLDRNDLGKVRAAHILLQANIIDEDIKRTKSEMMISINKSKKDSSFNPMIFDSKIKQMIPLSWVSQDRLPPAFGDKIKDADKTSFPILIEPFKMQNDMYTIAIFDYKKTRKINPNDDYDFLKQKAEMYYMEKIFKEKIAKWKNDFYVKINGF